MCHLGSASYMAVRKLTVCGVRGQNDDVLAIGPILSVTVFFIPPHQSDLKQDASLEDRSFTLEMEMLRKAFLRRPGCPQFCSRSTSMSHYGESHQHRPLGKAGGDLPGT